MSVVNMSYIHPPGACFSTFSANMAKTLIVFGSTQNGFIYNKNLSGVKVIYSINAEEKAARLQC